MQKGRTFRARGGNKRKKGEAFNREMATRKKEKKKGGEKVSTEGSNVIQQIQRFRLHWSCIAHSTNYQLQPDLTVCLALYSVISTGTHDHSDCFWSDAARIRRLGVHENLFQTTTQDRAWKKFQLGAKHVNTVIDYRLPHLLAVSSLATVVVCRHICDSNGNNFTESWIDRHFQWKHTLTHTHTLSLTHTCTHLHTHTTEQERCICYFQNNLTM